MIASQHSRGAQGHFGQFNLGHDCRPTGKEHSEQRPSEQTDASCDEDQQIVPQVWMARQRASLLWLRTHLRGLMESHDGRSGGEVRDLHKTVAHTGRLLKHLNETSGTGLRSFSQDHSASLDTPIDSLINSDLCSFQLACVQLTSEWSESVTSIFLFWVKKNCTTL